MASEPIAPPLWLKRMRVAPKDDGDRDDDKAAEHRPVLAASPCGSLCATSIAEVKERSIPFSVNKRMRQEKASVFPFLKFDGPVHYLTEVTAVEEWCRHIPYGTVIGFDTEWKPNFEKGTVPNKTALIQLCFEHNGEHICLLIHISVCGLPLLLRAVLASHIILKAGMAANGDARKLKEDYQIEVNGIVDISPLVPKRDLSRCIDPSAVYSKTEQSLVGLCERLLGKTVSKSRNVRMGNWEKYPLKPTQQLYAAIDAYASLLCYQALMELPEIKMPRPVTTTEPLSLAQSLPTTKMPNLIPPAVYRKELSRDVRIVHNMFMGVERMHLARHEITEIPQLAATDLESVRCYLADAVLCGWPYDWDRFFISSEIVRNLMAALLQCLTDKLHSTERDGEHQQIHSHPLARQSKPDFNLLPFPSLLWHLSFIVNGKRLFCRESGVIDFRVILLKMQFGLETLQSHLADWVSYGIVRLTLAHIGRCVTDSILGLLPVMA